MRLRSRRSATSPKRSPLLPEIWASPEVTVARIGVDEIRDQTIETGHHRRHDDVARLAALGVPATRYPILWERVAPVAPGAYDYRWADARLALLDEAGIEPIVTLLHHGSGPRWTDLLDPQFPELFADYAAATARRYPHVRRWTPINEPLTTARFSTLYAAWYPNRFFDHRAFGRAVVNQVRAIALACERIRDAVPHATFMLTEDLQSFSAADDGVAAYVEHKRERMYVTCELLAGRVVDGHPMFRYLIDTCGIAPAELDRLVRRPQPPDIMGWNYYPNSERWLESDGMGGHRNLAAVDVPVAEPLCLPPLLREAYARLRLPFALSEVHVMGNERERSRWLLQRLDDALEVRRDGVPVVALGAWAAFGMVDWTSLLRRRERRFEDGVYTFAGIDGVPRATLVAETLSELAAGRIPGKPLDRAWWERDGRAA